MTMATKKQRFGGSTLSLLLLLTALLTTSYVDSLSAPHRSTRIGKKDVVDRRKSPALWRLLDYHEQDHASSQQQPQQQPSRSTLYQKKPEIMSPAGGWEQLRAAVANGADAVYLGLTAFSARARASNFNARTDELAQAVAYCHRYNVHVYVALNTLVFDHELAEVAELVHLCAQAHVDALIVQDLGVCRLIKEMTRQLPSHMHRPQIHSSTQQSVTDADGVAFCQEQHGATRVVLGRELSVEEIRRVATHAAAAEGPPVEIETFVHGALCVSYSGQCFSSESWGGRSANRGQCAQACRLPYGLIVNGNLRDTQDMQYLLSPQDLCGIDQVPGLVEAGIACLKIEGRLKDASYVAATTRAYRNAVDEAWDARSKEVQSEKSSSRKILHTEETVKRNELQQLFSRGQDETYSGLTPGFLEGTRHQRLVRGRSPRHRGVHVGRVAIGTSLEFGLVVQVSEGEHLKLGDGIVIDRGLPQLEELGGPIWKLDDLGQGQWRVNLGRDTMKKWRFHEGGRRKNEPSFAPVDAHVWKTHDAAVEKKFRSLSEAPTPKRAVHVRVSGSIGEPLQVSISDGQMTAVGESDFLLQLAEGSGLSAKNVRKAVGTLGNTDFALQGDIDVSDIDNLAWCPISKVKEARRRAVEQWESLQMVAEPTQGANPMLTIEDIETIRSLPQDLLNTLQSKTNGHSGKESVGISVLCRNNDQVDAVCELIEASDAGLVDEIVIDFLELEGMRAAVDRIHPIRDDKAIRVVIASPRILKPDEGGIWKSLLALEPDALLVRSTGLLHRMKTLGGKGARVNVGTGGEDHWVRIPSLAGDFSLNIGNALTATELILAGLDRVTASYDLSANAITMMASLLGDLANRLEVVVHCKMPIFHTEHCVFARFLTKGNSYLDCGHVCTRNSLHLRDTRDGHDNLVLADMGCRNTVFAAQAQSGVYSLEQWQSMGIRRFRIELVDESVNDVQTVVRAYGEALMGRYSPSDVWGIIENIADSNGRVAGVSLGSFKNGQERRAGEISAKR